MPDALTGRERVVNECPMTGKTFCKKPMGRKTLLILVTMLILPLGLGVLGIAPYWMRDAMVEAAAEGNITQLSHLPILALLHPHRPR